MKQFVGIHFVGFGLSNDIVPRSWITGSHVKWPNKNAGKLAKNIATPLDSWKLYQIEVLCHASK